MMANNTSYGENQNCTNVDELMKHYYLPVAYTIIFVVGLVGNLTSLGIYLTKLQPLNSSSIIMVNLALTDLLYVLTMPFLVYYYSNGEIWTLGDVMCRFMRFGFYVNLYGSILSLTCLAVFRYVVVTKPLLAARVQQRVWGLIACLVVWIIAIAEILPMLMMISLVEKDKKTHCLDFASTTAVDNVRCYSLILTALGFLLPLIVVFMCYLCIVKKLANGPNNSCPRRKKARHVTVLILVVFVLCFLPYHVLRVWRIETRTMKDVSCMTNHAVHAAYIISRPLAGFNTFFNLAFYTLSGDKFRKAFLSTFYYWRLTKDRLLLKIAIISKKTNDLPSP